MQSTWQMGQSFERLLQTNSYNLTLYRDYYSNMKALKEFDLFSRKIQIGGLYWHEILEK